MSATVPDILADYAVIGAGSAGCVLASRLSERGASVVLLEAGPRDWHPMIHVPAGVLKLLYNPLVNWNYATDPEPGAAGRQIHWPRGRVLGGSSSINGMLWIRGNPADYDGWAQMGCKGWSFDDVLPHFKSIERYAPGAAEQRGKSGPILVEDYRTTLTLTHRFVDAAQQVGIALTKDLNGCQQEGVGYSQMSRNGRFRGSTARTFLAQAKGRPNLRIETKAFATRLLCEGRRCVGVVFRQDQRERRIRVAREVILSGGTVNSPHLLQVSGIGPAAHLRVNRRSGRARSAWRRRQFVRPLCNPHFAPRQRRGFHQRAVAWLAARPRDRALVDDRTRRPDLRCLQCAGVRAQSGGTGQSPDIQLLFSPASYDQNKFGALEREPGMTIAVSIARPESRGTIMAKSPDPVRAPVAEAQLPVGRPRPARCTCRHRPGAAYFCRSGARPAQRQGDHARTLRSPAKRALADYVRAARHDDLSHRRHL